MIDVFVLLCSVCLMLVGLVMIVFVLLFLR